MMKMYGNLAQYYDFLYSFKDYLSEAQSILDIIHQYKKSNGHDLLDVACGTGKHLNYFKNNFNCVGTDISENMLAIAKQSVKNVDFFTADMINIHLNKKFDVITCLFTSIGYVKTYDNLESTLKSFINHLKSGGVIIIEPWFTKSQYKSGYPQMTIYDSKEIKISRLSVSKIENNLSILDFYYLIAEKDSDVQSFQDRHELALFEPNEVLRIMHNLGLNAYFLTDPPNDERGLYVALLP